MDVLPFLPVEGHQTNATLGTAVTLTAPSRASKLLVQAFGANVRFTIGNTAPTATVGFQLKSEDPPLLIPVTSGQSVQIIQEAAGASVQFQWGR